MAGIHGYTEPIDSDFDDDGDFSVMVAHEIELTGKVELHPDGYWRSPTMWGVTPNRPKTRQELQEEWQQYLDDRERWVKEKADSEAYWKLPWLERLVVDMRLDEPLKPGEGRVVKDHALVSLTDLAKWQEDPVRAKLAEVWRGQGFVIFKL